MAVYGWTPFTEAAILYLISAGIQVVVLYVEARLCQGQLPPAEDQQSKLMQFKANYRDLKLAGEKAKALSQTIKYFQK